MKKIKLLKNSLLEKNQTCYQLLHRRSWSMMLLMMMSGDLATEAVIHTEWTGIWIFHDSSVYVITHIIICYIKSKSMIANKLTKTFSVNSHCWFLDQMKLINIQNHLLDCQSQEATAFKSSELMNISWIYYYRVNQAANWFAN